jgi:hypothetical protein
MSSARVALGKKFQPAPGTLVLTASKMREFDQCRRRYFLARVLNLRVEGNPDASLDPTGELPSGKFEHGGVSAAMVGSYVHEELEERHRNQATHNQSDRVCTDQPPIVAVDNAVRRHLDLCPGSDGATYLGGELDWRWYLPGKATLVNGRIDALWKHDDDTIEIRDYKTGSPLTTLDDEVGALMYALLGAANYPGHRLLVSYEYLGNEPERREDRVVTMSVTRDHLSAGRDRLERTITQIRKEQEFDPSPDVNTCRHCPYQTHCDAAATTAAKTAAKTAPQSGNR